MPHRLRSPGWQFRPAKQIQRLMAVDSMRRLASFRRVADYGYVGLGGYEFIDFDLVHRALGIHRMISIENSDDDARLKFNRPFPDISIRVGTTNDMLGGIDMSEPWVIWLDFCSSVDQSVLQDALLLGEKMAPGNMLLVTTNANAGREDDRLDRLEARVGPDRIPDDVNENKDLDGAGTANAQREILATEVAAGIHRRGDSTRFEQILDIRYADTSRMQTWGGVFVDDSTQGNFAAADFESLSQVSLAGSQPLTIDVPVLTAREVLKLEYELRHGEDPPQLDWLTTSEEQSFAELHRWYPRVPAPM
jgi:hypothetical protein